MSGIPGNRPGSPRQRPLGGLRHPPPGGHRSLHRLERPRFNLPAREQRPEVEGLGAGGRWIPFPVTRTDSDNAGAFINETPIRWCAGRGIEFTHSGAYVKNGLAWVVRKKAAVVRRPVGHPRKGPPLPGGAELSEPLPALLQAGGEDSGGV